MKGPIIFADIETTQARMIPLDELLESPTNPRRRGTPEQDQELLESVKQLGVLQPVLARPVNGHLELVFGHRRLRAAQGAGLVSLPVLVRELSDLEVIEAQLVENMQRADVAPLDEAAAVRRMTELGRSIDEVAAKLGKSRAYVYARLKLLDLAEPARKALEEGTLDASRALLIARLPSPKLQAEATKEITRLDFRGEAMSYREAREAIERRFLLRLAEAPWKLDDAELLPAAGPCTRCPKRSGNQVDLFTDEEPKDLCLEPTCFAKKKSAHGNRLVAEAKASGGKVIAGAEAKKMLDAWGRFSTPRGFESLDQRCYEDPKRRTFRQLLKGIDVERTVVASSKGEVVELVSEKGLRTLLEEAGHDFKRTDEYNPRTNQTRRQDRQRVREIALEQRALAQLAERAPQFTNGLLEGWRWLARATVEAAWHDSLKQVVARRGLERQLSKAKHGPKYEGLAETLIRSINAATVADAQGLAVEILCARSLHSLHRAPDDRYGRANQAARLACDLADIDLDALREAIKAEDDSAQKAKREKSRSREAKAKVKAAKAPAKASKKKPTKTAPAATPKAKKKRS